MVFQRIPWWPVVVCLGVVPSLRAQTLPNGVAAGDVDQNSAVLWTRSLAYGPVVFRCSAAINPDEAQVVEVQAVDPAIPVKVEVTGLTAGTLYLYRAINSAGDEASGTFRTPYDVGLHGLRFGVSGDWRGELGPFPAVRNAAARDLDFFVALGDTVYADIPSIDFPHPQALTIAEFRLKHNEVYRQRFGANHLVDMRQSTALFAMIDDHEIVDNFAGGAPGDSDPRFDRRGLFINESEIFENGLQVFQEYNPVRDEHYGLTGDARTSGKRRLYRYRTFGSDAAMLLLDARSFRDANLDSPFNPFARRQAAEFFHESFDASRTMLGQAQLAEFLLDLQQAQDAGITWKFVFVPEPIQNLGPALAGDRFEGYGHERSLILSYIETHAITNVVFVSADIHSTFINNLTYQRQVGEQQRPVQSFEITTGAVAYAAPFGPTIFEFAPLGVVTRGVSNFYNRLTLQRQDALISWLANLQLRMYGYSPIGLDGSSIPAELVEGKYLAVNTFGWSEFEIDAITQELTITTYGIDWYDQDELTANPDRILSRVPRIVSRLRVSPSDADVVPFDRALRGSRRRACGAVGGMGVLAPMGFALLEFIRGRIGAAGGNL